VINGIVLEFHHQIRTFALGVVNVLLLINVIVRRFGPDLSVMSRKSVNTLTMIMFIVVSTWVMTRWYVVEQVDV